MKSIETFLAKARWAFIVLAILFCSNSAIKVRAENPPNPDNLKRTADVVSPRLDWWALGGGGILASECKGIRLAATMGPFAAETTTGSGQQLFIGFWIPWETPTGVNNEVISPTSYQLLQNYPNPFNPSTTISYTLPRSSRVTLHILNIMGRRVRLLMDERQSIGNHKVIWDGRSDEGRIVSSGCYFLNIRAESIFGEAQSHARPFIRTIKMMLLK